MLPHFFKFIPFTCAFRMRRMIIKKKWEDIIHLYEEIYGENSEYGNYLIRYYAARAYTNLGKKERAYTLWNTILWFKNARFQRLRLAMTLENKEALIKIIREDVKDNIPSANTYLQKYREKYEHDDPLLEQAILEMGSEFRGFHKRDSLESLKTERNFKWGDVSFKQNGRLIQMISPCGIVSWWMPEDYDLGKTHVDLLRVCAHVLLKPITERLLDDWIPSRKAGIRPGLALSCGIDSIATLLLMPENTVALHHRRAFKSMLKHSNADITMSELKNKNKWVIDSILSDHEVLRTTIGKQIGFSTDYATCAHLILLADYYQLDSIAVGMPIDNSYLRKGASFRNFKEEERVWKYWSQLFGSIGLEYNAPLVGISQGGALKIVKEAGLEDIVNSCLRGSLGEGCRMCWKCFHKNGILGKPFDPTTGEIKLFLQQRPLKTAAHVIWVLQKLKLFDLVPDLKHLETLDLSWWDQYYPPALDLLPEKYYEIQKKSIELYLDPMPKPYAIENLDLFGIN